jgi:hypothetical protein
MTTLNDTITTSTGSDTITFTMDGDPTRYSIPAFDASTLSAYTASNVMCGTAASDTITITGSNGMYGHNTITGFNSTNLTSNYYAYNGIGGNTWSTSSWAAYGKPFEDNFPEWNAFRKLCNDYPGLDKAYENLKSIYTICYEDSILPKDDE